MIRKLIRAEIRALGDDEVEVVMSTAALARDGHVLIPAGAQIENYRANPIVLWSHDGDQPIGNAEDVEVGTEQLTARVRFAPLGISPEADKIRGLVKAGVVRAVSIGFDPVEAKPLDPAKPKGGLRIATWELYELSFVSVPSDPGAIVTNRSLGETMTDAAPAPRITRAAPRIGATRAVLAPGRRGLWQVSDLCSIFKQLGYAVDDAKWEASIENDQSKVPGMLAAVLHDLGDALLAMTSEEVAEALAGYELEPVEDDDDVLLVEVERAYIRAATSPAVRAFRRGLAHAKLRAGKTLSADTVTCLRDAKALHEEAIDLHRSAMRKNKDGVAAVDELLDRAGVKDSDATAPADPAPTAVDDAADAGERAAADFRRRQADALRLTSAA